MTGISSLMVGGKVLPTFTATLTSTAAWTYNGDVAAYVSDMLTATPTGGTGPYAYTAEVVSGEILFTDMGSAAGAQSVVLVSYSGDATVVRFLVTDANGVSTYTNNCSIS